MMSRLILLLLFILALAACAPAQPTVEEAAGALPGAVTTAAEEPAEERAEEPAVATVTPTATSAPVVADAVPQPATSVAQAGALRANDNIKGSLNPAVTIVEYGDFQCPACAAVAGLFSELAAAWPDDVQIVYRHFPLTQIHPHAQKAAEAAEAAGAQGAFWAYHDALFARQSELANLSPEAARELLIALATEQGLDVAQFTADLDDNLYADKVQLHAQDAANLGFSGTPTVIVDGALIPAGNLPTDLAIWGDYIRDQVALRDMEARQYAAAPALTIDPAQSYRATVTLENGDQFVIALLPQSAPQTVNSFVFLAENGWFDGVTFHRVVPGFVAQTGDPSGTGRGGPGYTIPNEIDPALSHNRAGVVAMANAGPDTNGSQWYVTLADAAFLDGDYTIFGEVVEGLEVVQAITPRDPADPAAPDGDRIDRVTVSVGE